MQERLRQIPSVDRLLITDKAGALMERFGRGATLAALRDVLEEVRSRILSGELISEECVALNALVSQASLALERELAPTLRSVINATGVIIHTNLGRAPLSAATREAMDAVARGYSTLEYDLAAGQRGHRSLHAERLLCALTGAEAALVVNNNAGAVLLALTGLAKGQDVVISRGQLVEIGGGFRVPDVMVESGARLVEVGTTNRTHLTDYVRALEDGDGCGRTALILRAHRSNFRLVGFSSEPTLAALVDIAEAHGVAVMDDLGSGALLDTSDFGLAHEPMVQESLEAGAHLVCFSGDKLLGGPQAGIIVGRASMVEPLKRHPLARALRADKLCLVALQRTLLHYLRGEAAEEVPVWRMIAQDQDQIAARATDWQRNWREAGLTATLVSGRSAVGGGSLPGETLPTTLVALETPNADAAAAALRAGAPPVVARIEEGHLVLDPRSVLEEQEPNLLKAVAVALMGDRENR